MQELLEEIREEVLKYGKLLNIVVPRPAAALTPQPAGEKADPGAMTGPHVSAEQKRRQQQAEGSTLAAAEPASSVSGIGCVYLLFESSKAAERAKVGWSYR